ncbi:MAG TPA: hypothetical protein VJA47_04040 [archaeon]|nr:hypothetical protein [archaeon]
MIKFAAIIVIILAVAFSLSYLSGFTRSEIVYDLTAAKDKPLDQFYEIWVYIGGSIALVLALSTIIYKIRKSKNRN